MHSLGLVVSVLLVVSSLGFGADDPKSVVFTEAGLANPYRVVVSGPDLGGEQRFFVAGYNYGDNTGEIRDETNAVLVTEKDIGNKKLFFRMGAAPQPPKIWMRGNTMYFTVVDPQDTKMGSPAVSIMSRDAAGKIRAVLESRKTKVAGTSWTYLQDVSGSTLASESWGSLMVYAGVANGLGLTIEKQILIRLDSDGQWHSLLDNPESLSYVRAFCSSQDALYVAGALSASATLFGVYRVTKGVLVAVNSSANLVGSGISCMPHGVQIYAVGSGKAMYSFLKDGENQPSVFFNGVGVGVLSLSDTIAQYNVLQFPAGETSAFALFPGGALAKISGAEAQLLEGFCAGSASAMDCPTSVAATTDGTEKVIVSQSRNIYQGPWTAYWLSSAPKKPLLPPLPIIRTIKGFANGGVGPFAPRSWVTVSLDSSGSLGAQLLPNASASVFMVVGGGGDQLSVALDECPMPVLSNSGKGELIAAVPDCVANRTQGKVTVTFRDPLGNVVVSAPVAVNVTVRADTFYRSQQDDGTSIVLAKDQSGTTVGSSAAPATIGSVVTLYGEGCGLPSDPKSIPAQGRNFPDEVALDPVNAFFGGVSVSLPTAIVGGTPGMCAYQLVIPADAEPGILPLWFGDDQAGAVWLAVSRQ